MRNKKMMRNIGRQLIAIIFVLVITTVVFSGCENSKNNPQPSVRVSEKRATNLQSSNGIIEIKERMFVAQLSDVYLNPLDYLTKTIKLEGIFFKEQFGENDYCFVARYAPGGCCGNDNQAGFEVRWSEENLQQLPEVNSWVEATGILKHYYENSSRYLYLELISLNVLDKRGMEYVR